MTESDVPIVVEVARVNTHLSLGASNDGIAEILITQGLTSYFISAPASA